MKRDEERQRQRFGAAFDTQLKRSVSGCLEWQGTVDEDGYGRRGSRYGERRAHRFAFARAYGPIPSGSIVRHTCDNPLCCEPLHLVIGSHLDNQKDKVSRQRQARGEKNNHAKITEHMVRQIRALAASGMSQTAIAPLVGLSVSAVHLIVKRRNWKHIE